MHFHSNLDYLYESDGRARVARRELQHAEGDSKGRLEAALSAAVSETSERVWRALEVTIVAVENWCGYFYAEADLYRTSYRWARPGDPEPGDGIRFGPLSHRTRKKASELTQLVAWLRENARSFETLALFMDDEDVVQSRIGGRHATRGLMFDHHDDMDSWSLNLAPEQFFEVQAAWRRAGLPENLFIEGARPRA